MKLLELEGGTVSFEFDAMDWTDLSAKIQQRFGAIQTLEHGPVHTEVEFGGERFTYYHEWDPCLISQSVAGTNMLREIIRG